MTESPEAPKPLEPLDPPKSPEMSPLVAFASRHGGVILFILAMAVALLEGLAVYASKQ